MTAILQSEDSATATVLYMALELSNKLWRLGFSHGELQQQVAIGVGNCEFRACDVCHSLADI